MQRRMVLILVGLSLVNAAAVKDDMFPFVAASGGPGEVKAFVAKAGGVDAVDSRAMTLLMHAAQAGTEKNVATLLSAGASVAPVDTLDRDALDIALLFGNHDVARQLLTAGAKPDRMYQNGQTRLTMAALRGDVATVHFLLLNGADRAKKSRDGLDVLASARKAGSEVTIALLTEFEPPPPMKRPEGLAEKDSLRLYAVSEYTHRDSLLAAIQAGRRSFAGCTFKALDLAGMNLSFLDMSEAELSGCDLRGALLMGTRLHKADLRNAYLRKANLQRADLTKVSVIDAYLTLADLRAVKGLAFHQLKRAANLFGTKLEPALAEQVKQYCEPLLTDPGSDWLTNPWFAEAKDLPGKDGKEP